MVADEVRKLAERTQKATEEVGTSIRQIQDDTKSAVESMAAGTQRVKTGVELARSAGESLQAIVPGSDSVQNMVGSIAAAAEEQSVAAHQISRSVEQINAVAQESHQAAGQSATAAAQLSTEAEKMLQLVAVFKA